MPTKLEQEAIILDKEAKLADFEGLDQAANLFRRQAQFLRDANELVAPERQMDWWTRLLLGDFPAWQSRLCQHHNWHSNLLIINRENGVC